ncbi:conserved hypothetical protein [delta proteobacterium NaphS2]|nr:conserved hypothetical protein [delta proteobacterium NaphS2]
MSTRKRRMSLNFFGYAEIRSIFGNARRLAGSRGCFACIQGLIKHTI